MKWSNGDEKTTALIDRPLFFIEQSSSWSGRDDGSHVELELRASPLWAKHIRYAVIACGWPLVVPNYSRLSGWLWQLALVFACLYAFFLLFLLVVGLRSDVHMRRRRAMSSQQHPPFERYKRTLVSGWLPALMVLTVTALMSIALLLNRKQMDNLDASTVAVMVYFLLGIGLPWLVYQLARSLGLFRLPGLTAWYRALPPKIERMVRPAIAPCPHPSEGWRHLDGLSQVIRRLALHEVIFRGASDRSVLTSAAALLTWRLAAITFPLIALFSLPFLINAMDYWDAGLRLPLTLAIFNWAAVALSYYAYAGEQGVTQEQRRLQWRRHLSLCRALGLRPEKVIVADIEPFFGSSGTRSAIFVFTVMVPMYLGLIDIVS